MVDHTHLQQEGGLVLPVAIGQYYCIQNTHESTRSFHSAPVLIARAPVLHDQFWTQVWGAANLLQSVLCVCRWLAPVV